MIKPKPEQFGLTTEAVTSLIEEKVRRETWRKTTIRNIMKGLWLVGSAIGAVVFFSHVNSSRYDVFSVFALLCFAALGFISVGLMISIVIYGVLDFLLDKLTTEPENFRNLKHFQEEVARYEAWFIRTQAEFWERLSGRGFEMEVANLLNRAGYCAHLSAAGGDGGVDIVLGDGTIVQCKAHRTPASPGIVRDLYGTLTHQNAPKAILISLSGVTDGVRSFIKDKPITVWDKSNLIALQKTLDKS